MLVSASWIDKPRNDFQPSASGGVDEDALFFPVPGSVGHRHEDEGALTMRVLCAADDRENAGLAQGRDTYLWQSRCVA